jgi:hypothetical protein
LSAGVMSALLFRSGRARVWARSSIRLSVGPLRARDVIRRALTEIVGLPRSRNVT